MTLVGWQEWVSLPEFGLVALKAKIDTGARTSVLHAESISIRGVGSSAVVSFSVRPSRRRPKMSIPVTARLLSIRDVTSSNGSKESRPVVETLLRIGEHAAKIEITLTDRSDMSARMLVGRRALAELDATIDPSATFLMPRLDYKLYPGWRAAAPSHPQRLKSVARPE